MHLRLTMALRFMRSRRKGVLTRFISFASTSGIALGVFAAILGFSAMNGFEYELENRVLSIVPSAWLKSSGESFKDPDEILEVLENSKDIVAAAPAFEQNAVLVSKQTFLPINLLGIDPVSEVRVIDLQEFLNVPISSLNAETSHSVSKMDDKLATNGLDADTLATQGLEADTLTANDLNAEKPSANNLGKDEQAAKQEFTNAQMDEKLASLPKQVRESIIQAQLAEQKALAQSQHIPNIILGASIARKLGVEVGETIEVFTLNLETVPNTADSKDLQENISSYEQNALGENRALEYGKLKQVLQAPQKVRVKVIGLMSIGGQLDSILALMDMRTLQKIVGVSGPNTIHIRTSELNRSQEIVYGAISGKIKENAYLSTWLSAYGKLYHDIQMVRQIMFLAMFLVLAVACFNIISNLMMMVGEKRREIAILLTMGSTPREIIATFSLMGLMSGAYGALIGVCLGVPFSMLLTPVTSHFKEWFGFDLLNPDVYFINFIPCRLDWIDLVTIITVSLCMSLGAALYPAYRASHVQPAQELNL